MKKGFKWTKLIFSVVTALSLAACSSGGNNSASSGAANGSAEGGQKISVNIAYGNQPGEPIDQLANKWKELAEQKSNGRLELKLFPSSQLGSEKDVIEQAKMGNNTIILTGYDFLMDYVPDMGIMTAPYLTDSTDDLFYLTTTDWFKGLTDQLKQKGLVVVTTNTLYGNRHLMTTKEVKSPDDMKGMKIRVPNSNTYIKTFEALGATPTPMPLADVYTSLQQGLIDGAENPLPVLQGTKTNEVAKFLALTEHTKIISPWVAGTAFFDTIPQDLQQILVETGDEAGEFAKAITNEQSEKVLEEFKQQGVKVTEVDLNQFKEKTKSVYTAFPQWSPNLYETVQDLLKNRK
ncbi:C4-dicarboxylate TRAP transporter substrate-binding protein [Brevibacillus fulvus]|uniref:Tripartite ATP-independent transporter DctP family solute receptor n=1 Tax=Brevibacillus fulvus TaxID=1125967 RepID=A0A938Y4A6_9BACL|nr:C4-dicarboxylate TRAP transporter substrate-binding protein [Brevibacillus fulvus]MBM7591342.1 tripartite ATP-independent transporter DctP family solute receptor [Brevibacillus fulvus]